MIGDGKIPHFVNKIEIDHNLGEKVTRIEDIISKVYLDVDQIENKDYQWMYQWAILTARNSSVDEINDNNIVMTTQSVILSERWPPLKILHNQVQIINSN